MSHLKTIGIGIGILALTGIGYGLLTPDRSPATSASAQQSPQPPRPVPQDPLHIAPHKALYKIEMISKRSSAQVLNISGDMFFEWTSACDAWTTNHRFSLTYEYAESPPMRITSDFTTYEPLDGETFNFNSRRRRDGELYEELRGEASITPGVPGKADYSMPDDLGFDLPAGTLFPMAHTLHVLRAAKNGEKFLVVPIFDGSDDEGPADVSASIGGPVNAMALLNPGKTINTSLINTPAWRVRLAFFPLYNNDESDADYEMSVVMHENGVISDMLVDYKDFSVTQKLVALESLPAPDCPASAPVPADRKGKKREFDRIKP